ncbi:MAG: peptidoglycan editing factor PgeF [Actinomycetota bacterium]
MLVSAELERTGVLVAFSERSGGVSDPPFDTLNLGFTRDDPDRVRANRSRLCSSLQIEAFARAWQVHGAGVGFVGPDAARAGFTDHVTAIPDTDALVTDVSGIALSILTADCVPVAIADRRGHTVAAVHAGWRGLAAGVIEAAVAEFRGGSPTAVIGPAIAAHHYEVGRDVADAVASVANGSVVGFEGDRITLDLPAAAAAILESNGVPVMERDASCTACEPARFFSYRRDGETGRQGMIVMRR